MVLVSGCLLETHIQLSFWRIQLRMTSEEILILPCYIKTALHGNCFYCNWRVDGDSEGVNLFFSVSEDKNAFNRLSLVK